MGAKKLKPSKKFNDSKPGLRDKEWDRLMKTVEEIKEDADKKLEEISSFCLNREINAIK